jgi:hypothetical protein
LGCHRQVRITYTDKVALFGKHTGIGRRSRCSSARSRRKTSTRLVDQMSRGGDKTAATSYVYDTRTFDNQSRESERERRHRSWAREFTRALEQEREQDYGLDIRRRH